MIRIGKPPFLECSTRGDRRFSAFCARLSTCGGRSIEDIYQAAKKFSDGTTNLTWRQAKGRCPVNLEEVKKLYAQLWDKYIEENPELLQVLKATSGLSDMFGQRGRQCQVLELWRIKEKT